VTSVFASTQNASRMNSRSISPVLFQQDPHNNVGTPKNPRPISNLGIVQDEAEKGTLMVKIVDAHIYRDTEAMGKMDPFVIV
jgi:hypothetical protein